jgi:DNA integrity scanning protein DisA with diadenylate cyclase activity
MLSLESFPIGWRDFLDIALVTICFYYILRFVRGTRAVAALQGLVLLFFVYVFARKMSLFTLSWLLENFFGSLFLVLVILFSDDIRKGLASINIRSFFRRPQTVSDSLIHELVKVSMDLAKTNTGAIIAIELGVPLGDYVQRGTPNSIAIIAPVFVFAKSMLTFTSS